jgi:hypothetical protein
MTVSEMAPASPSGSPAGSPVPLVAGAAAVLLGVFGLVLTAVSSAVVAASTYVGSAGTDPEGDAIAPALITAASALNCVGLLLTVALLIGGADAGRSATAWLAAVSVPWTCGFGLFFLTAPATDEVVERFRWLTLLGLGGAGLALTGLLTGAVLLGAEPGRRWLANRVLAGPSARTGATTGIGEPPAPLQVAPRRFWLASLVTSCGGVGLMAFLPLSALGSDPELVGLVITIGVTQFLLVTVPGLAAAKGARSARAGRRSGAATARISIAVPLFALPILTMLTALTGATSVFGSTEQITEAVVPPVAAVALGTVLIAAFVAGIAFALAGLAALADPRSERHLRRGG